MKGDFAAAILPEIGASIEPTKRGVTVDYDVEDFEDDLRAIEKLLPR